MKNYRNLSSVIRQVVTEAHTKDHSEDQPPFIPDKKSPFKKPAGAGQPRAQALAQRGREDEMKKIKMKMRESFGLDITYEEADDLLNSIQESTWLDEYGMDAYAHEKVAAKHLKDADAHKRSGNMPEHYAAMINHYTSKAKADEKRKGPPRGTGPA